MKTRTTYNSKEEFESKNPYVIAEINVYDGKTNTTEYKGFRTKKQAEAYLEKNLFGSTSHEVMTRRKFNNEAIFAE